MSITSPVAWYMVMAWAVQADRAGAAAGRGDVPLPREVAGRAVAAKPVLGQLQRPEMCRCGWSCGVDARPRAGSHAVNSFGGERPRRTHYDAASPGSVPPSPV